MYHFFFKRLFDIILSFFFIILIFPIIILIIFINFIILRRNPLFIQERSGIKGIPINIIKIKTLYDFDSNDSKQRNYPFGSFLRKYKIDEIPQLINVFIGNMSLIGPRPLYLEYNKSYTKYEKKRLLVKPGITGLAQIKVINAGNWRDKFKFDVWYVENLSFRLDIYIIFKTIFLLFEIFLSKKTFIEDHTFKDAD